MRLSRSGSDRTWWDAMIAVYVDRFNARDFDTVRDMLLNSTAATTTPSQILPGSASSISKSCYSKNQAGPRKPASRNKKAIGDTRSGSRADYLSATVIVIF